MLKKFKIKKLGFHKKMKKLKKLNTKMKKTAPNKHENEKMESLQFIENNVISDQKWPE